MPTPSSPRLTTLRGFLWPQGGVPWRSDPAPWPARLLLLAVLALVLAVNAASLEANPFPRPSSHRTWRLVPEMMQHFMGWGHHNPSQGAAYLGGMGCYYSLEPHRPLPWTSPTGLWRELGPGGRLFQLWGTCPNDFFTCMPHAYAVPAAVGALFPGHFLLVALVPTAYFLALLAALYGIGVEVAGRRTGLVAAAVGAGYPALFGFARWPEGYIAASSLATLMVWLLLRSRGLTRPWPLLGFSVLAWSAIRNGEGLGESIGAGMAVAGPFAVELGRGVVTSVRARRLPWRTLGGLALILGLLAISMDWRWLVGSLNETLFSFTESYVDAHPRDPGASPAMAALVSRGIYPLLVWTDYLKPLMACWAILGFSLLLFRRPKHWPTLLLWFLVPLIGCSSMTKKALYYALPIVPPLAVITAAGLASLRRPGLRLTLLSLAGACGLYHLLVLSTPPLHLHWPVPRWLRGPRTVDLVDVRWYDLLFPGDADTAAMKRDADAFLAWLDTEVPRTDRLKQVGVLTPWGDDVYPAQALRWYLALHRPDLSVVELSEHRYTEQDYPRLTPDQFAFVLRTDSSGRFLTWHGADAASVPLNPDRREQPPPALTRMLGRLAVRARGTAPGIPPVLVLSFSETDDLVVDPLR